MRKLLFKVNGKTVMTSTNYGVSGHFIYIHDHTSGVAKADVYRQFLGIPFYLGEYEIDSSTTNLTYKEIT